MVFILLTVNIFHTFSSVSIIDFEQVNISAVSSWSQWSLFPGKLLYADGLVIFSESLKCLKGKVKTRKGFKGLGIKTVRN